MKRLIISIILTVFTVYLLKDLFWTDKFDASVFIIISSVSFMVLYKLVQYLGILKIVESHSRIDIIFAVCVILFMFIPMSKMDNSEINRRENRTMAVYKNFFTNDKINFEYGKNFDEWFNDRFRFRTFFINAFNKVNRKINGRLISDKAMIGEDGWLFSKSYKAEAMFQNDNLFTDEELKLITNNVNKFNEWSKAQGAKFYISLFPDKETVYGEFYPKNYGKVNDISRIEQVVKHIRETTDVPVIYPYDELMKEKEKQVLYYKTGTHWNDTGAYIGYRALFERIKKDFPSLTIKNMNDLKPEKRLEADIDIANLLLIDAYKEYPKEDMENIFYYPKNKAKCTSEVINHKDKFKGYFYTYECPEQRNNLTAFFYSDSFLLQTHNYAPESFRNMYNIFIGFGNNFTMKGENGEFLRNSKADIIVFSSAERFLYRLLDFKTPEGK